MTLITWIFFTWCNLICLLINTAFTADMPKAINIRLVNGPDPSQGRVEIQSADGNPNLNPWGTVCNDHYELNNKAATVICRQLGYSWGESSSNSKFGDGDKSMPIFFDQLMCNGSETSLTKCYSSGWGVHNCYHHEDVGAICHNQTVRLQSHTKSGDVGVVQVMFNFKWADACDTGWNDTAATIVCKELGYVYGKAECCSALGPSQFSNVDRSLSYNCTGIETRLQECSNSSYMGMCDYSHRASVVCHKKTKTEVDMGFALRLAGGDVYWGRVEVRHSGIWGLVCNDQWTDMSANVTCKQLGQGYIGGVAFGTVETPTMPFWLVDLKCQGNETSIEKCVYTQWGYPLPFSCSAAYVLCYKTSGIQIDIVGGVVPSQGRVQITYDGEPGSICTNEWTDNDAFRVCQMKGYYDGVVKKPDPKKSNSPPYFLNRLICNTPNNIYMCSSLGWRRKTENCTEAANVMCFKQVRLSAGGETAGIVEVYDSNAWVGLCDLGFTDKHAGQICTELGFGSGSLLFPGAYGKYYNRNLGLSRPYLNCTGNETSIMDCGYDSFVKCSSSQYRYVAVSCYKQDVQEAMQYKLVGPEPDSGYGRVDVRGYQIWGQICADGWQDTEAHAFCKSQGRGYSGGVAVYYGMRLRLPTLLYGLSCPDVDTVFANCTKKVYRICQSSLRAGAICYKTEAPSVSLVGGGKNFGRVQIRTDNLQGSVCDFTWTDVEATVVCNEISSEYLQGEPYKNFPVATGDVVLNNMECSGLEKSILKCSNGGWNSVVRQSCLDHSNDVGVYCYGKVRLMDGLKSMDYILGRVVVRPKEVNSGSSDRGVTVCGEGFDQVDADVVCLGMGFSEAKILAPGSFGVKSLWKFYTNMTCKAGGSDVHSNCSYEQGNCRLATHNYASVMCHNSRLDAAPKVFIKNGYQGTVVVQQYGINGTICVDEWDDVDASVLCREKGYNGGVVLGVPEVFSRKEVIWYTNISCIGNETSLLNCRRSENVGMKCTTYLKSAGVLCYKAEVQLKLVNSKAANYYGTVQIVHDSMIGTVCDYDWSPYDAKVTCRQLGFPDGDAFRKSYFGAGNGSIFLSGMTCDNTEKSLLECPNSGWRIARSLCLDHDRDAGVRCTRNVMTEQAPNYGVVKVWKDQGYYLVCADEFDDNDATVVCRTMGFPYGKSLCCSAFGFQVTRIGFTKSGCTGREINYNNCPKSEDHACSSGTYASVVCSRDEPLKSFDISIDDYQKGMGSGAVRVKYMGENGYVCAEDFDDADANVTCRQLGYTGGYAYKYYNDDVRMRSTKDLRWLRGPACTGSETRLELCMGVNIGNVTGCFVLSHAAVFCYKTKEQSTFEVRMQNSPHPGEGYVQVKVNGTWGSVCTLNTLISNSEATVVCREKGFKFGVEVPVPSYPHLNGSVWLTDINCHGNESTVRECLLSGMGAQVSDSCKTHNYDMAVKCYTDVRVHSLSPNYGMVQVLNNTSSRWFAVCDTGFDDVDARIVCKSIGYKDGLAQCCSSLGTKLTYHNPIQVVNVQCKGDEKDFSSCQYEMGSNVTCASGTYASVVCTDVSPPVEGLSVSIADDKPYGNVVAERYGIKGAVCDISWDNNDANVLCKSLSFVSGYATNGTNTGENPMIMTSINCSGSETSLSQCSIPPLSKGHECNSRRTRAAVVCSMDQEPIAYRIADKVNNQGRAEIYFNGRWGTICDLYWEDKDADVFCRAAGYLFGETSLIKSGKSDMPIWMSHVECTGNETDFMQCRASWDSKSIARCSHYDDAGVKCYSSARLNRGDYRTQRTNGIVEIYVPQTNAYTTSWYTVCADSFTDKEAEVVCRILGHTHGLAVCCSPYGYNTSPMWKLRPKCNGTESQITDCQSVSNDTLCSRQNYASVTCYNTTRSQSAYSVGLKGSLKYTGQVVLTYLNVPGRICWKGWGDADARVVCRELGYKNGSSYYHYKSSFIYLDYNGPYWTSRVNCTGDERRLSDCPHEGFGNVTECDNNHQGHYAGVICYDDIETAYRINGGNSRYGRVEFSYDSTWYSVCSTSWGTAEANVTCRQLGYVTGDTYSGAYLTNATRKSYSIDFRCKGDESNLNQCPHEGIQEALYCDDYKHDEGVFCYTSVKLSGDGNTGNGTVLFYQDDKWNLVCDDEFDDITARRVCQELGYQDGRAICCSAFGDSLMMEDFDIDINDFYEDMRPEDKHLNYSLHCDGDVRKIEECLKKRPCNSNHYASAICFKSDSKIDEDEYTIKLQKKDQGQVEVTHYGVTGRICSREWDDNDANVLCRSKGFKNGVAYQHSENNVLSEKKGPYWLSGFNCTGNESALMNCPHHERLDLGNCTDYHIAAVLCYDENGIRYRMVDGGNHYGRVEISVGSRWGTICDQFWDRNEARVFCRQLNFTDGEPMGAAHFGRGTGPIWLSHLQCKGTESSLHHCPHRGFANEFSYDWWFPLPCETHSDDAGVFCYKSVRLSTGPNTNAGGLEVHRNGSWYGVCDVGFDINAAIVACRSVRKDYIDARPIPGSGYGNTTGSILFSSVKCNGSETEFTDCTMEINTTCSSNRYVSVVCSNETIVDTGFQLRLAGDSLSSKVHGILEVRVKGIWGRVCLHDFDDTDASVACKHLGFDGGVAYLHIMKNDKPVLLSEVNCNGSVTSLDQCQSKLLSPNLEHCHYGSNDAGVICYRKTNNIGFNYRLAGGKDANTGRVEIGYDGRWGLVCAWSWQSADAKVLCRSLGYKDGIVSYDKDSSLQYSRPWVTGFFCKGEESTPMTCLNTGFNSTFLTDLCQGQRDSGAYSQCFNDKVEGVGIRLVNGPDKYTGRVEVYVTGANSWGTICDDYWDDDDAAVVCRQLGFHGGTAKTRAPYGAGKGPIWYDNVKCLGNESTIFDCVHRGIGTHNCNHTEDVGVICEGKPPVTVTSQTKTPVTKKPTTAAPTPSQPPSPPTTTSTNKPPVTTQKPVTKTPITKATPIKTTKPTVKTTTEKATTTTPLPTTSASKPVVQTTKASSVKPPTTNTPSTGTPPFMTTEANQTGSLKHSSPAKSNLAAAVGIPVIVLILIAILVAVIVFVKLRRGKKPSYAQERFGDSVINRGQDGTVSASNQLYDLDLQSASHNGLRDFNSASDEKMTLNKNGNAYYSKGGMSNGDLDNSNSSAFTNPLYEARTNLGDITEGQNGGVNTLPTTAEITLPDASLHDGHTNA